MIVDKSYVFSTDPLPNHVCDDIVKLGLHKKEQQGEVGLDGNIDGKIRDSRIVWLDEPWIYDWISPFVHATNNQLGWNFDISFCEKIQFTKYKEKQFYGWHQDSIHKKDQLHRKISVVIPLTDGKDYEGGDLEFCNPNIMFKDESIIRDEKTRDRGRIIIFPSYVFHQVTPILKGERLSIVIWYSGPTWK